MKRISFFTLFLVMYSAMASEPNRCLYFSIMISNNTKETCRLLDKNIKHGKISSSTQVPVLIMPGNSSYPFEMKQQIMGPEIVLTYQCGKGNEVSFYSAQGLCIASHGSINAGVLYSQNLTATFNRDSGSYLWDRNGAINWMISSY
ncbi:MAG: hypothetical protein A3E88_06345 [Legionellales bacterium RIFCSPHIGHO2_12_FULL_35_11]|nr:MAG: hypothetical protein A3E88_06345 [Legionellales bacterium RIFCSPHIGHO2_12_FULL_35_11]